MKNRTSMLSVIIPLYNVGDSFRDCMESLLAQTWTALEIIIVNDGSTDNSVDIAQHYADNYSHVRLLHQANVGASVARNRGWKRPKGIMLHLSMPMTGLSQYVRNPDDHGNSG